MKKIAILGSTGSIGTQALDVVRQHPDQFIVSAISANSNIVMLEEQIREFSPKYVVVYDKGKAKELKENVKDLQVAVLAGMDGLIEIATLEEVDILLTALVGMIGIRPTIAGIKAGKDIALANKETLVTAGHIIMELVRQYKVKLLPVDSEHSAIFQCLNGENNKEVEKILLTASGGPFRGKTRERLKSVTLEDALKHPNWAMGRKITIDSSTLMNKGLEVIEAHWLFQMPYDNIQVVVHPQSYIHSMVQFRDGGIMAQIGCPDMRLPIQYAFTYPSRATLQGERLDFWKINSFTFEKPDMETFKGLALAYEAGKIGGSMPTVYNASNECAVQLFLEGKIAYLQITELVEYCMNVHQVIENPSLDQILETEQWVYEVVRRHVSVFRGKK